MSLRRIGDAARAVVSRLPVERNLNADQNDAKLEFLFSCCEGQPAGRQKRLILLARSEGVGLIDDATASLAMNALGLRAA